MMIFFYSMVFVLLLGIVSSITPVNAQTENTNTENISKPSFTENYHQEFKEKSHSNRLIILFDEELSQIQKSSMFPQNYTKLYDYSIFNGMTIDIQNETSLSAIKEGFEQQPHVVKVFEDYPIRSFLSDSLQQVHGEIPHSNGYTGSGVKVCVVDSGVEDSHPALNQLIAEVDFVNDDLDATDDYGHGTHVAGIVSSTNNTFSGLAPGASLMAAKVLNSNGMGDASDVIAGIEWCVENGANVINLSLGTLTLFSSSCDGEPIAMAANNATNLGVVVVAASGNNGVEDEMASPACGTNVLAVGSVNKSNVRASFSNGGIELDVVAPGVSITSTVPTGPCNLCDLSGWKSLQGTSMAAPHVSGAAALILDKHPSWSPLQVQNELKNNAIDLGEPGFDFLYGNGRLDLIFLFDEPPEVTIISPLTGSNFTESESIAFSGTALDIDDGDISSLLEWTSDLGGLIGTGGSFTNSSLSIGTHAITANVTDTNGSSDSKQMQVTITVNTDPEITIISPANGTAFSVGESILFNATANDLEDGSISSLLEWTSDLGGLIGTGGSFTNSSLSIGTHAITANVTDSGNKNDVEQISIIIEINFPCSPPVSGDWIITSSCFLSLSNSAPANVIIQNNSVLEIPNETTLDIDFANFNLTIESGSGVLVRSGGTIT